nr:uncharacterized protein LOC124810516 [Hydra vulgaris]
MLFIILFMVVLPGEKSITLLLVLLSILLTSAQQVTGNYSKTDYIRCETSDLLTNTKVLTRKPISCEIQTKNSKLLITTFYRSPNSNEENDNYINQHITNLSEKYENILIVGDFNYPDITWSNKKENPISHSSKSLKFIYSICNCFLTQHISKPTHFRKNQKPTTIDLIITSVENIISPIISPCSNWKKSSTPFILYRTNRSNR